MRLVTGGAWQDKKKWAMHQWTLREDDIVDGAECGEDALAYAAAVDHFHLLVKRWISENRDVNAETEKLLKGNADRIIITDEIGGGIVPLDMEERQYREIHGRICCRLAAEASEVYRVFCGIGQRIK